MKKILTIIIFIVFASQIFAQNITADTILAKQHFKTAEKYYKNKSYDTAAIYFEKASVKYLQVCQNSKLWQTYGYKYLLSETKHGECYHKQRKYKQAIAIIKPAIEKSILYLKNDTIIAKAYSNLGLQYYYLSKFSSTVTYWKKSANIYNELFGEKNKSLATLYNNIAVAYTAMFNLDKAYEYNLLSLNIRKELFEPNHSDIAMSYNNIGNVCLHKSDYADALYNYHLSLQIYKNIFGSMHPFVSRAYNNIGIVYAKKFELEKALDYSLRAAEITKDLYGNKNLMISDYYNNIGGIYSNKTEYDKALIYFFKALEIKHKLLGNVDLNIARIYINIGSAYRNKSEYQKALEYYQKALDIGDELLGQNNMIVAMAYNNMAVVFNKKNEYDRALEYCLKNLKISKALLGKKHTDLAVPYINVASVYEYKKEYETALKYYQYAISAILLDYNDTTNIYFVPRITKCLNQEFFLESLFYKAQILGNTNKHLSDTLKTSNRYRIALRHYQAADTLISQVRKKIVTKLDKFALGEQANEIYKGAVNVCLQLYQQTNKQEYLQQAFYFSEKNKSSVLLESLAGAEALNFSGIPDTLLNLEYKLNVNITNYINLKNNAENDSLANVWNNKLFTLQHSYDSLITVFETKYPKYYNLKYNNSPVTIEQVSNLLDKKTAILSYFLGDSTITIFAISKKDFLVTQIAKPENFNQKIQDYRYNISETDLFVDEMFWETHTSVTEYEKLAFQFYNLLFPPEIQEFLKGGIFYDIENLIIIPDGQLATIPFETFHTQKYNGKWTDWKSKTYFAEMPYLIKEYNISYSYSATLFQETKPKEKTDKIEITPINDWLAFAPVFDDENTAGTTTRTRELLTFETQQNDSITKRRYLTNGKYVSPLPGSKEEIETIFNLYQQQGKKALIKTHQQANETFVKSNELQNYRIIHFATHGFVNEKNPKFSGILFAQDTTAIDKESFENIAGLVAQQNEGILYQSEIYNLNFNADLVVLSACETGLGKITDGEGVIGLTRALLRRQIFTSVFLVSVHFDR